MTKQQHDALMELARALQTVADLAEQSDYFNNEILAGELGHVWKMSIDEMAAEVRGVAQCRRN